MSTRASRQQAAKWFFVLMAAAVLFLSWRIVEPFVLVLMTAGIVAVVVSPVAGVLESVFKSPKFVSVLMVISVFVVLFLPIFSMGALMVQQASDLFDATLGRGGWLTELDRTQIPFFEILPAPVRKEVMSFNVLELINLAADWGMEHLGGVFSSGARVVFNIFFFFIALYYFLAERKKLYAEALAISPFGDRLDAKILKRIVGTVRGVVFGALVIAVIQGIMAALGMTIFGVPGALLWGALVIVAAQVPMVGVSLVMVPAVLYLYFTGEPMGALGLLIWSILAVGLIDNLLSPIIVGGRTQLHAFLVLIAILGGLQVFGPIGLIVGPTILAGLMVVVELYKNGILEEGVH